MAMLLLMVWAFEKVFFATSIKKEHFRIKQPV
jgi:hypothetical protein